MRAHNKNTAWLEIPISIIMYASIIITPLCLKFYIGISNWIIVIISILIIILNFVILEYLGGYNFDRIRYMRQKHYVKIRQKKLNQKFKDAKKISELFPNVKQINVKYEQVYKNHRYGFTSIEKMSECPPHENIYRNHEEETIKKKGYFDLLNIKDRDDDKFILYIQCANPTCCGAGFYLNDIASQAIKEEKEFINGKLKCSYADNEYREESCDDVLMYEIQISYY